MTSIGIIGAGISGVHAALRLQQLGVGTTVYAERTPDELRTARPANLVARFEHTRARERALGVAHWEFPDFGMFSAHLSVEAEPGLGFVGRLSSPASFVDFRIYLPRLLEDYERRGGRVVLGPVTTDALPALARRHDLVVVASGGRALGELFPRDPSRSPYTAPQRRLFAGMFRGIRYPEPLGLGFHLCPGAGEIFQSPFYSFGGRVSGVLVEAIPGGPLEPITRRPYDDDPVGFERALLGVLAEHAPAIRERVDEREFSLARPIDHLQGAITPVVRRGWAALDRGRYAVAVGDAWILNDPIVGQGANLGSHCAFVLADAIAAGGPFDEQFCRRVSERMWAFARPVTEWTNAFLQPPPPHAFTLLAAAAADQRVADAFIDNFGDPPAMWASLSSPEGTAAFLSGIRPAPVAAASYP